jgi:PAS domain S-box-containing protein
MQTPDKNIRDIQLEDKASGEDEARLCKMLLDHAPFAAFAIKGEHFCCYVNHAAEQLTGYSRDELLRMDYRDIIHPDFRELIVSRFKARIEGSTAPSRYEIKIITGRSEERWIDLNATTIDFAGERLILATALDISERKRYEESLLLSDFTIEKSGSTVGKAIKRGDRYYVEVSGSTQATIEDGRIYKSGSTWASVEDAQRIYDCPDIVAATLWVLQQKGKL